MSRVVNIFLMILAHHSFVIISMWVAINVSYLHTSTQMFWRGILLDKYGIYFHLSTFVAIPFQSRQGTGRLCWLNELNSHLDPNFVMNLRNTLLLFTFCIIKAEVSVISGKRSKSNFWYLISLTRKLSCIILYSFSLFCFLYFGLIEFFSEENISEIFITAQQQI